MRFRRRALLQIGDFLEQKLCGCARHPGWSLTHDSERRSQDFGEFKIIESHDRNIFRHSQLVKVERLDEIHGGDSLQCECRRWPFFVLGGGPALRQSLHRLKAVDLGKKKRVEASLMHRKL